MARRIVCFGPGPKFKGGIANYNTALAKVLDEFDDVEVYLVSWIQQYPAIVPREFVDKTSKLDFLEGTNVKVNYITNYNKPSTWKATYQFIKNLNPDIAIFQWYNAHQGIPLNKIVKRLKKSTDIEVLFDLHFVVPKEDSNVDIKLTRKGLKRADGYIVHALKTANELQELFPEQKYHISESGERTKKEDEKSVIKLFHPIYSIFEPQSDFDETAFKKEHNLKENVFLFFGFIRKYKGLHLAIESFAKLAQERDDVSLLICGESFWNTLDNKKFGTKVKNFFFGIAKAIFTKKADDEKNYNPLKLIEEFGIADRCLIVNKFVPNEDVHKYFQVSDAVVLYYLTATPSGVESLSYNFKMPILATNVGHFPETIKNGFNGYLAEPGNIEDMTAKMNQIIDQPIDRKNVDEATKKMSWVNYAKAILNS
ncbi:MAG: glycosyltransferase involved in cell wall biosynthesis [Parvicellaceae bacterium]|jgi:glycosyltransferase involved in cell wall biosynthesis